MRGATVVALAGIVLLVASLVPWPGMGGAVQGATAGAETSATRSEETLIAEGRALFVAKGCLTCHRFPALEGERRDYLVGFVEEAPTLTAYQNDPTFLREWLRDPKAVRPNTSMPNLELSEEEITALIAFLNAP